MQTIAMATNFKTDGVCHYHAYMRGMATGETKGRLVGKTTEGVLQIESLANHPFSAPGDSGSLVFVKENDDDRCALCLNIKLRFNTTFVCYPNWRILLDYCEKNSCGGIKMSFLNPTFGHVELEKQALLNMNGRKYSKLRNLIKILLKRVSKEVPMQF